MCIGMPRRCLYIWSNVVCRVSILKLNYKYANWLKTIHCFLPYKSTLWNTCSSGGLPWRNYLMVYSSVPSSLILKSLLGMVMLWATDFFPLWKKVSGVQILLAIRLLRGRMFMGPLNFNLSSFQLWRKKTSIVYSWRQRQKKNPIESLNLLFQPTSQLKASRLSAEILETCLGVPSLLLTRV